ncbi:tRNA ligase class II core domain protein [Cooperia oncophora]
MGCALKANMLQEWRKHFILEEGMLEVDCTSLTPEAVLKASGHVDRFADWMVKDLKTGECFRADHLIKNAAEKIIADKKADEATKTALQDVLARLEGFDDKDMQEQNGNEDENRRRNMSSPCPPVSSFSLSIQRPLYQYRSLEHHSPEATGTEFIDHSTQSENA